MSKPVILNQPDGNGVDICASEDASAFLAPSIGCWEALRWELTRATLQRSSALGENQLTHPNRKQER
jgi:hypothetical protein